MPYFTKDHTLYYEILQDNITPSASSHTVLLLHGFLGTAKSDFAGIISQLQKRQNILALDLYGYGKSSKRTSYNINYYRDDVNDVKNLLNDLKLQEVHVLGFSDGGIVGLLLAALHTKQVKSLAILGAQARLEQKDVTTIRHWLLEKPLAENWQKELGLLHGESYWHSLPAMYVQGQEKLLEAGGDLIKKQELAQIQCPTLIMHGKRDRIVPVAYAFELQQHIKKAQLQLFDAGHAAHLKCVEEYKQAVMEFLETS